MRHSEINSQAGLDCAPSAADTHRVSLGAVDRFGVGVFDVPGSSVLAVGSAPKRRPGPVRTVVVPPVIQDEPSAAWGVTVPLNSNGYRDECSSVLPNRCITNSVPRDRNVTSVAVHYTAYIMCLNFLLYQLCE